MKRALDSTLEAPVSFCATFCPLSAAADLRLSRVLPLTQADGGQIQFARHFMEPEVDLDLGIVFRNPDPPAHTTSHFSKM